MIFWINLSHNNRKIDGFSMLVLNKIKKYIFLILDKKVSIKENKIKLEWNYFRIRALG